MRIYEMRIFVLVYLSFLHLRNMEQQEWIRSWGFLLHTFLKRMGLLYVSAKILSFCEPCVRYVVCVFYSVYGFCYGTQRPPGDASDPPLVFITGLLGFDLQHLFGVKYFNFDDSETTRRICIPQLTNIGNNRLRARQAIDQILLTYPGCFDDNKQVDFIAHSQGTLCCDEIIHFLSIQYDKPVRSYIRISGISKSPAIAEAVVSGNTYGSLIIVWIISYFFMLVNMVNHIVPCTRRIYELGVPYGLNANDVLQMAFKGFIASDVTNDLIFSKRTRTINIVTASTQWYSHGFLNALVTLGFVVIQALTLGTVCKSSNDGLLCTNEQTITIAKKIVEIEQATTISEDQIGEIQICCAHTSVLDFPSHVGSTLGTAFQLLTAMHH